MTCIYVYINHLPVYVRSASPVLYGNNLWIYYAIFGLVCPILCAIIKDYLVQFLNSLNIINSK